MFGLTEERYLAGDGDTPPNIVVTSAVTWKTGYVPQDTQSNGYLTPQGREGSPMLKAGQVVRAYKGTFPEGALLKSAVKTPQVGPDGVSYYLIEPAGAKYWLGYKDSPEWEALEQTADFQRRIPEMRDSLVWAPLDLKDLKDLPEDKNASVEANGLFDPAVYETDAEGYPVLDASGKPKKKASKGDGGNDHHVDVPPKKEQAGGGGIALLIGAALILLLLNSRK